MRQPTPQQRVDSILRYLSNMQRVAEALHDRNGAGDYSHAWLIVAQRFYGRYRPVTFPRFHAGAARIAPPKPKTTEQTLMVLAPLRKIVQRLPHLWRSADRRTKHTTWDERLSCGHWSHGFIYFDGERRARRRKCRQCIPAAKTRVLKFPREVAI